MSSNPLFDRLLRAGGASATAIHTDTGRYSYGDIERETGRLANALVALGVGPGDRVAVQVEKSAANLLLYLATVRAGAVYLPLNTAYTMAELAYFIDDAEPALIVCDPSARGGVTPLARGAPVETLDQVGEGSLPFQASTHADAFETVARSPDDLAAICYTSGTTDRPRSRRWTSGRGG